LKYFDSTQTKKIRTFLMDMMAMSIHSCYIYIQRFPQISVISPKIYNYFGNIYKNIMINNF
jgi:hypothetical protein